MPLLPPAHVVNAGVVDNQLVFLWDEWNLLPYYNHPGEGWQPRLKGLSVRANLALAAACAEWICYRFSVVSSDPQPYQVIEAAWAGVVSPSYVQMMEPHEADWRGPDRGPLFVVMLILTDAFNAMDEDQNEEVRAIWMQNLAHHLMPSREAFDAWFALVVNRLEQSYPRPVEEEGLFTGLPPGMGDPVPREAFDTLRPFDASEAPGLIDAFLRTLDTKTNPYLLPADDVDASDFEGGTAYRYP